ncbi:MAG TPA: hypothetical protein VKZ89_16970, partial [Thermobifida alba]|nr:hypothetical protein [Thermobifida alba]
MRQRDAGIDPLVDSAPLFAEFAPALRERLIDLADLLGPRSTDPTPGDHTHTSLVEAIAAVAAERVLHRDKAFRASP